MEAAAFNALSSWVAEAGLIGRGEGELMAGFCRRVTEAGVPLARALVILDTPPPDLRRPRLALALRQTGDGRGQGIRTHE